jgi:hypothetical protein
MDPKEFLVNRSFDDSSAISSGAQADTYYDDDTRLKLTADKLEVARRLKEGEIDESEAYTMLDLIASREE